MPETLITYIYQKESGFVYENTFTLEQIEEGHYYDWYMQDVPDDAMLIEKKIEIKLK